jgi:hypothetical protein
MKNVQLFFCSFFCLLLITCKKKDNTNTAADQKTGTVKITFKNTVKGSPVVLNTATYTNSFAEQYTITTFKYYISNVVINNIDKRVAEKESYHLINETQPTTLSFSYTAPTDLYTTISFMLGVDSMRNVSGAQTGALDPTNDMFWTWNSGYIMAKLEGNSPQSTVVNNMVEYHIGGFAGANNVLQTIVLNLPANKLLNIREGKTSEVFIEADIDKWWQNPNDLKIATNAVCTTPGVLAKKIADNYAKMFVIKEVTNN